MSWIEEPNVPVFRSLDLSTLGVDQAFVNVSSDVRNLWLYTLSEECYKCPYVRYKSIDEIKEPFVRSTQYSEKWRILSDGSALTVPVNNDSYLCEINTNLGQFGVYDLWIRDDNGDTSCELTTVVKPVNIYLPLVICAVSLILIWAIIAIIATVIDRWKRKKNHTITPIGHELRSSDDRGNASKQSSLRKRVKSLDAFRGISIVLMIFVNYGAGGYTVLEHATWNGLQLADILFPWFMWIMGVCIPISVSSQLKKNVARCRMFIAVVRRSCILFLLGVMLNTVGSNQLETIRIFGVLQRFGIVYFVVATISIFFSCRHCNTPKIKCIAAIHDFLVLLPQWILVGCFVAGHCALTFLLPIPNCPLGYLGPGGNHDDTQYKDCIGGATGYVDRLILGKDHIYQNPTASWVYNSGAFDPEGIVGCLTSIFQVFLGVQAGTIIVIHQGWKGRIARWVFWGTICGIGGAVLCLCSKEDGWIPINKNLWSVSFVLVTSCFAFYLLSICYILIDIKKWWSGAPFIYPGMNATIMYVGHSIAENLFPWHWSIGSMNTHSILLLENVWGTLLWIIVAFWLHQSNFFLSI